MNHLCVLMACTALASGCHQMNNQFKDQLAALPPVTTPSVEGVRAAAIEPAVVQVRFDEPNATAPVDGSVTHGPLYFEDPFDEPPMFDDGRFAWSAGDYVHVVRWRVRFLANLVFLPVSFVTTPPWVTMESDGIPSRRVLCTTFDARPVRQRAEDVDRAEPGEPVVEPMENVP